MNLMGNTDFNILLVLVRMNLSQIASQDVFPVSFFCSYPDQVKTGGGSEIFVIIISEPNEQSIYSLEEWRKLK